MIASTPTKIPINVCDLIPDLLTLLSKNVRTLKLHTLECLNALVNQYGIELKSKLGALLKECALFISEEDLQLASFALDLARRVYVLDNSLEETHAVVAKAIELAGSVVVEGHTQQRMCEFFRAFASNPAAKFEKTLEALEGQVSARNSCPAQCIATMLKQTGSVSVYVKRYVGMLGKVADEKQR